MFEDRVVQQVDDGIGVLGCGASAMPTSHLGPLPISVSVSSATVSS